MKRKLLKAALFVAFAIGGGNSLSAQTNYVAGWDGGSSTASPSTFGWTSSANRTFNSRNAGGGIRMTTTYSGYTLENGTTSYSYSANSDPSSVIFWVRYKSSGESFTYTFKGLEANHYYAFSALVGWHNNNDYTPTFTVKLNDGTKDLTDMSKSTPNKQRLYSISSQFTAPSTITTNTDIKVVFTCDRTGDCIEAISALKLVENFEAYRTELSNLITYASSINSTLNNSVLATAIATAQGKVDDTTNNVTYSDVSDLKSTISTAVAGGISDGDVSYLVYNPGFELSSAETSNWAAQSTANSADYTSTGWTNYSNGAWSSSAIVAYGGTGQVNGASAPSADNANGSGNTLGISFGYNTIVAYKSTAAVTLPAGRYSMEVYGYNNYNNTSFISKNGFVPTSGASMLSIKNTFTSNTWEKDAIEFTLTEATEGVFQIGGQANSGGSGSNGKVFFDNIALTYTSPATLYANTVDDVTSNYYNSDTYTSVTGSERTALYNALNPVSAPSTTDEYFDAIDAISDAVTVFSAAAASYDAFDVEKDRAIAIGVSSADIVRPTSADNLQDALYALYVLEDAATTTGYTVDATDIFGAWTPQNTGSASGQHWSGDGRSYIDKNDNKGFTMSVTNTVTLPVGKYVFKAAARAANGGVNGAFNMNVTVGSNATVYEHYNAQGNTGKGIDTSGAANYGEGTFANDGNGRGWEWRFIGFELTEETSVTMQVYAQILANNWVSFSDITLWTTTDNVEICRQMWAASKAAAESARDNGTYANVGGKEKKDLTDAIGASVTETIGWYTNQKEILDDVTATFTATSTVTAYDRLAAALATATSISFDDTAYEATDATTAEDALSNANTLYAAMLEEQKTAKGGRVLGFDVVEYAPYNNVEVVTALNAANAIGNDNVATTASATLDTAIKNLNDASWSDPNATEVNAFYDGTFSSYAVQETSADNTKLKGWTSGNNFRQILKTTETFPGLEYATDQTAIFSWSGGGSYGSETGYTMPLKANTYYILKFKAAGWNNETRGNITVSVLNGEDGLAATNMGKADKDIQVGLTSFTKIFKTGEAGGDYIFSISSPNNIVFTDVSITKCPTVDANMKITAAKYATFIAPFDVQIPDDVTAMTVAETTASTTTLELTELTDGVIPANTPVVLYSEAVVDENFSGQDIATEETYSVGALTGVYVDTSAPVGSYVLQNHAEGLGFYQVSEGKQPTVKANRAYLTDNSDQANVRAFFFDSEDLTGIDAIGTLTSGQYDAIYTGNGVKVKSLQKGMNIVVKGSKSYKIFVK